MVKDERLIKVDSDLKRLELGIKKLDKEIKDLKVQVTKQGKDIKEILCLVKLLTELAESNE